MIFFSEDFLRAKKGAGPGMIEEVINWRAVVSKYLQLIGQGDGEGDDLDFDDEEEGGGGGGGGGEPAGGGGGEEAA